MFALWTILTGCNLMVGNNWLALGCVVCQVLALFTDRDEK